MIAVVPSTRELQYAVGDVNFSSRLWIFAFWNAKQNKLLLMTSIYCIRNSACYHLCPYMRVSYHQSRDLLEIIDVQVSCRAEQIKRQIANLLYLVFAYCDSLGPYIEIKLGVSVYCIHSGVCIFVLKTTL